VKPMGNQVHACAAKAGVNMVTKCLAIEWGPDGIRVNGIAPGPIADTEGVRRLMPSGDALAEFTASIPLGRFGEKRDIAELSIFLSTPSAGYITGAIIDCDGGSVLTHRSSSGGFEG